jgi:ribosome maturation factor RimP
VMATAHDTAARLTDLLEPEASANGFEIVLVEVPSAARGPLVRVFLDRAGGIGIDDIAAANTWIKPRLDGVPQFKAGYTLEVSSPGIERPLVKIADYERFAGSEARLTSSVEIGGRKRFSGTIRGVEGGDVVLDAGGTETRIPFGAITRARLRADIDLRREGTAGHGL